jgi:NAD(P)-dependent dehydrogenase (short-subunit alcohol dehydrogenase family)
MSFLPKNGASISGKYRSSGISRSLFINQSNFSMNLSDFQNKTALITGAGSGLGRAAALLFAQRGARVVVSDRNDEGGHETVRLITEQGGQAMYIHCDVTQEDQVNALIAKTVEAYGSLDAAVNNAGIGGIWTKSHQYPTDNFELVQAVNVTGVFMCMRAQLQVMLEQGSGSIVNVSSVSGLVGFPYNLAYAASKHAVIGLTRTVALEYASKNIRVNSVCPVFTITPMVEGMFEVIGAEGREKFQKSIPMRRYGRPEEIADAIVWLCSDASSFVTGHNLPIDGGMTAG